MECLSCTAEIPEGSRFCDECGAPAPIGCPSCGASNRPRAKFCSKCGSKLTASSTAPSATPTASPAPLSSSSMSSAERRQLTVVGDLIGAGVAREHGVVGETPNLAARLQALAEPGGIVVDPLTRQLTGNLFDFCDLGLVEVKGLPRPVRAARVLGPTKVESRFEALRSAALTPLVGRDEEVALLLRRWRQIEGGEGRVVLISGEPG